MRKKQKFNSLEEIAKNFRAKLREKKYILLFAYNKTGKTRLSGEFKKIGQKKDENGETMFSDTLYYNAFTEDLFWWDNDLENDSNRKLYFNKNSKFFIAMKELSIDEKIREILHNFADFDFNINYDENTITFKKIDNANIKISRSEESLFILCFFFAVVEIVLKQNNEKSKTYDWVKYIYIDDPVSSLDDNNIIAIAVYIANLFKHNKSNDTDDKKKQIPVVVSTHHTLFYNVMYNEWNKALKGNSYFLSSSENKDENTVKYILENTNDMPFFYHVAMLDKIIEAVNNDKLFTYHFTILRGILEKTSSFFGYSDFSICFEKYKERNDDLYKRAVNLLSHENYSLFKPATMVEDTKKLFKEILYVFLNNYKFNVDKKIIEKVENNE